MSKHDWNKQAAAAYPALLAAYEAKEAAQVLFTAELSNTFKPGTSVRVRHHSGEYLGTVERVSKHRGEQQVYVRNARTGKVTARYPLLDVNGGLSIEIAEVDHD